MTVVPEEPAPGESTRIEATLGNLRSSNETVEVTDVYVRKAGTAQEGEGVYKALYDRMMHHVGLARRGSVRHALVLPPSGCHGSDSTVRPHRPRS